MFLVILDIVENPGQIRLIPFKYALYSYQKSKNFHDIVTIIDGVTIASRLQVLAVFSNLSNRAS